MADPAELEGDELFSGGSAVLTSSAFAGIELEPMVDEAGEIVPDRWRNLEVSVDGQPVDVRRIAAESMEFDVPVLPAGTYGVDVVAGDASASLSAPLLGVVAGGNVSRSSGCSFSPTVLLPVGDVMLIRSYCWELNDGLDSPSPEIVGRQGYAFFRPMNAASGVRWIDGLHVDDEPRRYGWIAPGPSVRADHFIAHRPAPDSVPPDTWVWRAGSDPQPVEPIDCFDVAGNYQGTAIAEPSPGLCLAYKPTGPNYDTVWRDGELIATDVDGPLFADFYFVLSADGWSALRGTTELLVFDAGANLAVREQLVDGWIKDVAFAPDGRLFVVHQRSEYGAPNALQVRSRADGEILESVTFQRELEAVSFRDGRLWLASWKSFADETLRIDVFDPDGLELLRSVVVSSHYLDYPHFFPSLVGDSPVLRVDAFGRASISGWGSHSGIRTHTVEAF